MSFTKRGRWPAKDWLEAGRHPRERGLVEEIGQRAWLCLWDESHHPKVIVSARINRAARAHLEEKHGKGEN